MNNVQALPGAFPLHEDRDFLSESEWVIFKLLCRPIDSIGEERAETLSEATGGQVTPERCDELIRIVRIKQLDGVGSWIARMFAESGLDELQLQTLPAEEITEKVNSKLGYMICNDATTRALASLQLQWKGAKGSGA